MNDTRSDLPLSRRDLLRTTGLAVGAIAAGVHRTAAQENAAPSLGPSEFATLEAITARIIPNDENGPGAREALAARFIERGLGGALGNSLVLYREGLAAIDEAARDRFGRTFTGLSEDNQDALLAAAQDGGIESFPGSAQFFNMARTHTIQGTFSDPIYGGNRNFAGWDMIGYPGVRVGVPPSYQQMNADHTPNHVSAYDTGMFTRPEGMEDAER